MSLSSSDDTAGPQARVAGSRSLVMPVAAVFTGLVLLSLAGYGLVSMTRDAPDALHLATLADNRLFWMAVLVGFLAQAIDGALGMAYGVTATTFLLSSGASPAVASASVHLAEVFTTGCSGLSHLRFGNINRQLFLRLLLPGVIGAVLGAWFITSIDAAVFKPIITMYLLLMGVYLLCRVFRRLPSRRRKQRHIGKLALFGGFVDSAGGGGWGPVVTTTLLGAGNEPRTTIGSVNFAEFFLALASAASFVLLLGTETWPVVAGLIVGGVLAAPFAAWLCSRLNQRVLLAIVGVLICSLSLWNLVRMFIIR